MPLYTNIPGRTVAYYFNYISTAAAMAIYSWAAECTSFDVSALHQIHLYDLDSHPSFSTSERASSDRERRLKHACFHHQRHHAQLCLEGPLMRVREPIPVESNLNCTAHQTVDFPAAKRGYEFSMAFSVAQCESSSLPVSGLPDQYIVQSSSYPWSCSLRPARPRLRLRGVGTRSARRRPGRHRTRRRPMWISVALTQFWRCPGLRRPIDDWEFVVQLGKAWEGVSVVVRVQASSEHRRM